MPNSQTPLSDEERAELEQLRAEKARRDKARAEAAQRAELDELRREQRASAADERAAAQRERAREYMEPDEDLKMPLAQKLVLLFLAIVIAVFVVNFVGSGYLGH